MRKPSVWTRLRARAAGEIPAHELDAYRAASLEAWALVESAAERRRTGEIDPVENLGAWIVFGLQTFGNALMDAETAADPKTVGFVPPKWHGTIVRLYDEIAPWLLRATEARAGTGRPFARKTPFGLPQTPYEVQETPAGVMALLTTLRALRDELPHVSPEAPEIGAAALALARYAEARVGPVVTPEEAVRLGRPLRKAVGELFRAGQIAAHPALRPKHSRERIE